MEFNVGSDVWYICNHTTKSVGSTLSYVFSSVLQGYQVWTFQKRYRVSGCIYTWLP